MAHNLYQGTLAFTGALPWHRLGIQFQEAFTSAEAIEAARLGYNVSKQELYLRSDTGFVAVPNGWATVNDDTKDILGIVGDDYTPLQNREAFDFFDVLLQESGARYVTAGALGKGERVWLLAQLPDSFAPLYGDPVNKYCLLSNGHDGRHLVTVRFTPIRVVCQNTLTAALKSSPETVALRHTSNVHARLKASATIMQQCADYFSHLGETLAQLAQVRIDDEWIEAYEEALFPQPNALNATTAAQTRRQSKVSAFEQRLYHGMGTELPGVLGSAWGAYNAAVEWADYEYPTRSTSPTARTNSILFGSANEFKQNALTQALALVEA